MGAHATMDGVDRIDALLARALPWDNHACMPLRPEDESFLPQLERVRDAGFAAVSLNIGCAEQTPIEHLNVVAAFRRWLKARPEHYRLIATPDDVAAAREAGQLAVTFDIEGARGIGDQIGLVEMYFDLGVRWMLLAYNRENLVGYGCYDAEDGGLKPFGRAVIVEMNRVGMTVCCSHTGERTARDALEASQKPVIFSHSNAKAVFDHPRNLTDDMIRACAAQGGVIGINGIGDFVGPGGIDDVEAYVRHLDHMVQLVGPDHVGIAFDYVYDQQELIDYLNTMKHTFPDGFSGEVRMLGPEALRPVLAKLIGLGYDDAALEKILGGSWMRVARANWG